MRLNLPISDKEYPFPAGHTLVSTTDAKGRIVYCNPAFVEVSGFSREELLGKPHNIIRHPDMPEEAFRDMWATISSGRPWSAAVKNRRKNGDYYWVMANATPLLEDGEPVGYMSVRTEATREQIEEAEALYAVMREEAESGRRVHVLSEGRLVKRTLAGRLAQCARLGLTNTLMAAWMGWLLCFLMVDRWMPSDTPVWTGAGWALRLALVAAAWSLLHGYVAAPLKEVLAAAHRLAAGDLTQAPRQTRSDELGSLQAALAQVRVNVGSVVRDARDQSQDIVSGTAEIARGNTDLSGRTEAQAGNVQQTAASMEQITGTVSLAADSAQRVSGLSAQTRLVAERGAVAVEQVSATMQAMLESSRRISEITQVIDSIAFQTNILALNAAVEAARAGEDGRGFAVVAGEVRSLAQRSAHAAKEIRQLIEESSVKVAEGGERTEAARKTMADVVAGVQEVNTLIAEITDAAKEQLTGIAQVNAAVAQLDSITQQNAALVEQVAASATSLEGLARNTHETMRVFRLDSGLDGGASVRRPAPQSGSRVTIIKGYPQAS